MAFPEVEGEEHFLPSYLNGVYLLWSVIPETVSTSKMPVPSGIQEARMLASSLQRSASFPFKANTSSQKVERNRVVLGKEEVPAD